MIDALMYQHIVTGNYESFKESILSRQCDVLRLRHERVKNNVLHIAARFGHVRFVEEILRYWPGLMVQGNSQGNLPIHLAFEGGRLECVEAMISWLKRKSSSDNDILEQVLGCNTNRRKNTLLHIALEMLYDFEHYCAIMPIIVRELVELYPLACYAMNKEGICPLYLAISNELVDIVREILVRLHPFKQDGVLRCLKNKPVLHAAVSANTIEILEEMLSFDGEELIKSQDKQGLTALSYAAYMGYTKQVQILMATLPQSAFISNKDSSFPIHLAVLGGHTSVINLLTTSMLLLNARSQNILHVAVVAADFAMLSHLLNLLLLDNNNVETLINQRDGDGDSPLHLAKKSTVQRLVSVLERASRGLMSFPIDGDLYRLLVCGDVNQVCQIVSGKGFRLKDLGCPKDGCTVLHVATNTDQPLTILEVLRRDCDMLMYQANNKGDLPIHYAAKAGKFRSLKALVEWRNFSEGVCKHLNVDGNTALHIALLNNHQKMAKYLYNKCPETAYYLNKDSICPLFLAIKTLGNCDLVNEMINGLEGNTRVQSDLKIAKSVVHVSIFARRVAILKTLIGKAPELMDSLDSRGRNPVSYAAHIGYADVVQLLVKRFPYLEFKRDEDKDGSFPIHQAAKGGQVKVLKLLHPKICLLNNKHQSILHVAAETGRTNVVSFLLRVQEIKELLNTGDENGNTPLHLAVKGGHYNIVNQLTLQKHINGNLLNAELLTPRDMFETYLRNQHEKITSRKKRNIMELMLKRVNGEKSRLKDKDRSTSDEDEVNEKKMEQEVQTREMMKMGSLSSSSSSSSWVHLKSTRERSNTFLVVATLIISVSFTATFTPPGDYKEDSGIPNFISTSAFRVFMVCNHFAFLAAVTSAINVIIGMNVKRLTDISLFIGGLHILLGILWMCGAFFAASVEVQLSCLLKPTESEWMWLIVRRMLEVVAVPLFPVIAFYTMKFKAFSELQILCFHLFSSQQTPHLDYTI